MSETLVKKIGEFQAKYDEALAKNSTDTAEVKSMVAKAAEDITSIMAKAQAEESEVKAKQKALEDQISSMETIMTSQANSMKEKSNGIDEELRSELAGYFIKGVEPSRETGERVAREVAGQLFGISAKSEEAALKAKSMLEGIGSAGGYFVQPERVGFKVERSFESSPFREEASVMQIAGNEIEVLIDDDEATAPSTVGEVTPRGTAVATPRIGLLRITAGELDETVDVTQRILDDYPSIDTWLLGKLNDKFDRTEATNLTIGDGVEKHNGLLSKDPWTTAGVYERNKIEQIISGTDGDFDGDFFINLQNSLFEKFQSNAKWFMRRQTFGNVLKLKDTKGNYLINLQNMMLLGAEKMLLGAPVKFASDMPAMATDSLSVLYGDVKQAYQIVDRLGMRILRDPYSNKPMISFTAYKRSGGDYKNYQAVKIGKLAAS